MSDFLRGYMFKVPPDFEVFQNQDSFFSISAVRDPICRLVSAYRSKMLTNRKRYKPLRIEVIERFR